MEETFYKIVYIDIEYKIKDDHHTKIFDNGIEYIKYKRRIEHDTQPVIFTSFYSLENILERPNTQIITTIGHDFLRLPYTNEDLNEKLVHLKALNPIQLSDIIINFCQLRGSLRESFHIFKGRIRQIMAGSNNEAIKSAALLKEFDIFNKTLIKDYSTYPEIIHEFKSLVKHFNPQNISTIHLVNAETEERFSKFLPSDDQDPEEVVSIKKPYTILFLDDNPDELSPITQLLDQRKISYKIVTTVTEAKICIEEDIYNQICVVVCDYRLFEKEKKYPKMQPEQGYDFILWVAYQNRYNALIALSGLSKWFLLDSFRKHRLNVKVYAKAGLVGGGIKLFVDDIEYLGEQYQEIVFNQPKASLWTENQYSNAEKTKLKNFSLKPYYVYHRNHDTYLQNEDYLNITAEKLAREIEYALDTDVQFNFASFVSIQGKVTKTLKGNFEQEYPDFLLKLLQRRVFYYLQLKGFEIEEIIKMLHKGEHQEIMSESMLKQIPSMLAIQPQTDLPYHLLAEEKYFLSKYMNVPIYDMAEFMNQAYTILNDILDKYLNFKNFNDYGLERYCIVKDGDIKMKSVSFSEAVIIIEKMVRALQSLHQLDSALSLLNETMDCLWRIIDILPNRKLMEKAIKKLETLKITMNG
ncbi:MAG: hypothetical protein QM539_04420 [Alphaproteobacteria bacterium]|nr:hypothetical protein [Alphaproteobacteria bacterium]